MSTTKRKIKRKAVNGDIAAPSKLKSTKVEGEPSTGFVDEYKYITGFGGEISSEALDGALPIGQNSPQKCPYNLFAEQLSGTSFTTPRVHNQRIWLYRIKPSVCHTPLEEVEPGKIVADFSNCVIEPNQLRWKPFPLPKASQSVDFIQGMTTIAGTGSAESKAGVAIHVYACNTSMEDKVFCNADGDMLIVPQLGTLRVRTECGYMVVKPGEICVVQRGFRWSVEVSETSRGYICEIFDGHFRLPDLGPIGANGLANPRDFKSPVASYENKNGRFTMVQKFVGKLYEGTYKSSPFDVVAWHGNYVPFKYNLADFVVINSVSIDHLDPSIFTVLTCPTPNPGVAALDFAIFPPRWCVQEKTFRPPYYHRNCMSEFMGNILGKYEAKPDGFAPGSGSLHSCMIAHGPDADCYEATSKGDLEPVYLGDALAFMFESTYTFRLTQHAADLPKDKNYWKCWQGLKNEFTGPKEGSA